MTLCNSLERAGGRLFILCCPCFHNCFLCLLGCRALLGCQLHPLLPVARLQGCPLAWLKKSTTVARPCAEARLLPPSLTSTDLHLRAPSCDHTSLLFHPSMTPPPAGPRTPDTKHAHRRTSHGAVSTVFPHSNCTHDTFSLGHRRWHFGLQFLLLGVVDAHSLSICMTPKNNSSWNRRLNISIRKRL